jgi:hypothetical protein
LPNRSPHAINAHLCRVNSDPGSISRRFQILPIMAKQS